MTTRLSFLAAFLPLVALSACKSQTSANTGIIVDITSDLAVTKEMNQVLMTAKDSQGNKLYERTFDLGSGANRVVPPFRVELLAHEETSKPMTVQVVGQLNGGFVVSRSATLSFVPGEVKVLYLPLLAVCRSVKCTAAFATCKDSGQCEPDSVNSANLPTYVPDQPAPGEDAAVRPADLGPDAVTADVSRDTSPDRQADATRDVAKDAPVSTGTSMATGTGSASESSTDTGTASASGSGTGQSTGSTTGTGTGNTGTGTSTMGTGTGTKTGTGSGSTATTTGTGSLTRTGTGTGTGSGSAVTGTGTGTGTGSANTGTGTGTGSAATSTGTGTGTGTGGTNTGTGTGTGTGKSAGTGCSGTGECQAGLTCLDGVCCTQASCAQCQNCGAAGTCSITVSSAEDTSGVTCSGTNTCNAAGVCKKKPGESCTPTGGECATGTCTDNRCCSQTCGVCQACTGAGGTCVAITGADDPDSCTGTSTCNAAGVCKTKPGESCTPTGGECATGTCTDNRCCSQTCGVCQACTGAGGTCVAVIGAEDADSCTGMSTCNESGACKKKDGQPCTGAGDCLSGSCNASNICGPTTTTSRCVGLAATCGPSGNGDCCASLPVTGGTFYRGYDGIDFTSQIYPATVSDFYLDKYEITVGRFRQFVEAGKGTQLSPPAAGDGVHPLIAGSGWSSTWNTSLAANTAALTTKMKCSSTYQTWTDTAGANESKPINCLDWYTAFAFCAWDGGRLATEAEWNYAASGGNEQRYYPWSTTSTVIDASYAVYGISSTQNVGSKSPKGDGKWGQSDLAGNVWEWNLDWYATFVSPCSNCADLTAASYRVIRGGSFFYGASYLRSAYRSSSTPGSRGNDIGARCARTGS